MLDYYMEVGSRDRLFVGEKVVGKVMALSRTDIEDIHKELVVLGSLKIEVHF